MLEVSREASKKTISATRHASDSSKAALNAELEKVNGAIDQVKQKTKDDMKEAYHIFHEKTEVAKGHSRHMHEAFQEYAKKKSHEAIGKVAEESKEAINNIDQSVKGHDKKLLYHSQNKVAAWLKALANKIEQ